MRRRNFLKQGLGAVCGAGLVAGQTGQGRTLNELSYSAALYSIGLPSEGSAINVFPFVGEAVRIPIPFNITAVVSDRQGQDLYVQDYRRGIYRLEFNPTRAVPVVSSEDLGDAGVLFSIVGTSVLLVGKTARGAAVVSEFDLQNRRIRKIFESSQVSRHDVKVALLPGRTRALANFDGRLQMIDLDAGGGTPVLEEFRGASWSPDGKWIAAIPRKSDRAVLLKATDFSQVRDLRLDALAWSPDSRFLVGDRPRLIDLRCGFDISTPEMVEVETGKISTIRNASCTFSGGFLFWINNNLVSGR